MADNGITSKRDYHLDALKGFAIILVIVGHIAAFSQSVPLNDNWVYQLIYSFHMPLFFFVSGYLVSGRFGPTTGAWIKRKFMQLIIPYILYSIFFYYFLFGFSVDRMTLTAVVHTLLSYTIPDSAWFLPVLFESFLVLSLLIHAEKIVGKYSHPIFFLIAALVLPLTGLTSIPFVFQIVVYTPFVIAGYLVGNYKDRMSEKNVTLIKIFGSILFPLLFLIRFSSYYLASDPTLFHLYYVYVTALAGIILSWVLVRFVMKHTISGIFVICGIYSLEIYLTHLIILGSFSANHWPLWFGSGAAAILTGSVELLVLALVASFLISYNETISTFILGRWSLKYFKNYLVENKLTPEK